MSLRVRALIVVAGFACGLYGLYLLAGEGWTWTVGGVVAVLAAASYDDRPRRPATPTPTQGDRTVR